ncbi:MAG: type 4a pilus biogenesis protein PilO [Anaerovibrio sp.]|nr:type 4a pilus biogenesis protein PilO [Anaerovibrio sp.]
MYPLIKTMIAEDKAENANLEYKLQEMRDFQTKYKDIHKYEKDAEITYNFSKKLLPVQPALEEYIASLEENAVKYRLMIISLQPAKERKNKQLGEIPLEYGVQGDFFDIMNFLGWLQEGERFTTTNKLQLKCSSDGLECHINTSIFYLIEDK